MAKEIKKQETKQEAPILNIADAKILQVETEGKLYSLLSPMDTTYEKAAVACLTLSNMLIAQQKKILEAQAKKAEEKKELPAELPVVEEPAKEPEAEVKEESPEDNSEEGIEENL